MTADIHACNLYCDRPECIRRQRDELRDQQAANVPAPDALQRLHALVLVGDHWLSHWPDYGGPPARPTPGPLRRLYDELERAENFLVENGINVYAKKETRR